MKSPQIRVQTAILHQLKIWFSNMNANFSLNILLIYFLVSILILIIGGGGKPTLWKLLIYFSYQILTQEVQS